MLAFFKIWVLRRKAKKLTGQSVGDVKITREEMRDLFADVLSQKTTARHKV